MDRKGRRTTFDHIVVATHADQALALLADPSRQESEILGAFRYTRNEAVLHGDDSLMPRRRGVWSSWNYLSAAPSGSPKRPTVSYWMNRLQRLDTRRQLFVTLNPLRDPDRSKVMRREVYSHPVYDARAMNAQARLWDLQGARRTWYCGAYFGSGFHEDGLQAGLAVAEALGGVRRPWSVARESGRIRIGESRVPNRREAALA